MFSYKTLYGDLYKGHSLIAFAVFIKEMLCLSQREVVSLGRRGHWYIEAATLLGWSRLVWEPVSGSRRNVWLLHLSRKHSVRSQSSMRSWCAALRGARVGWLTTWVCLNFSILALKVLYPGKPLSTWKTHRIGHFSSAYRLNTPITLSLCRNDKMVIKNCGTF